MLALPAFFLILLAAFVSFVPSQDGGSVAFDWDSRIDSLALQDNNATAGGCEQACSWLHELMPTREFDPSTTPYFKERTFFWSAQQRAVKPQCFVQPACAAEVAAVVRLVRRAWCPFAIKAGGHAAFEGASSAPDGVTIDLALLDELALADDEATVRVGAGNRWADLYEYLDPRKVSVVGGRVADIGVGGLVLGGGISFFSGRHGWALDGVRKYELVTADGEILDVNRASHPDLYWALRGGGNNFGVVTRFDLDAFPQESMWGGATTVGAEHADALHDALVRFARHGADEDVDASAYVCWARNPTEAGEIFAVTELTYAHPVADPPAVLRDFAAIPHLGSTVRTMTNMTDLAREINQSNPNGLRQTYRTATFSMDRDLLDDCLLAFREGAESLRKVPGAVPAIIMQPVSRGVLEGFRRNGGNCLGLDESEGPLLLLLVAVMWTDEADDEAVLAAATSILDRSVAAGKEKGLWNHFIYQNYAARDQDVFASYGEDNLARLRAISRRYDPDQVFQRLQPGYFKL